MEYCNVYLKIAAPNSPAIGTMNGDIVFTPDNERGSVWSEGDTITPSAVVRCELSNGVLTHNGKSKVQLMAGGGGVNPEKVYWRVAFENIMLGEEQVQIDPFVFEAIPGETIDLARVTPVMGYTPPGVIRGPVGLKFLGVVNRASDLPSNPNQGDAYVNIANKNVFIWNGSKWEEIEDFASVDGNVETFNTVLLQTLDAAERAEFAAEETVQQVEGDFATRNYADEKDWVKRNLGATEDLNLVTTPGVYPITYGSTMSSLVNRPLGFVHNGFLVVYVSRTTVFQVLTQNDTRGPVSVKRNTRGGVFGEWVPTDGLTQVFNYSDYNDAVVEGSYDIGTFAKARDVANRPPTTPSSLNLQVLKIGGDRLYQRIIGTNPDGVSEKWERRRAADGVWSDWAGVYTDVASNVVDTNKVVTVGDSQVGASYAWANLLAGVTGQTVVNMGVGGYTPDEALMNSGVREMVTTSAVTLPPATDVPVTVVEPPIVAKNRSRVWVGTISGVSVEFKYSDTLSTFALRNRGTSTIEVPAGSVWVSNAKGNHPDHRRVVWFGGNSIRQGMSQPWETPAEHVMRAYSDAISEWGDTTIVCGYVPAYGDTAGRDAANELNEWLARVVPTQFLDMRHRIQLAAPDIIGRGLTIGEQQDIADGYLPQPLYREDNVHLTDEAHVKIAEIVAEFPHGATPQLAMQSKSNPVVSLISEVSTSGISFAVVDEKNRRTWLEAGEDGKPTDYARKQIQETVDTNDLSFGVVDKDGRRTWLEVDEDGGPTNYALSKIGNTGAPSDVPDFPTADWAHWGDSNTDSYHLGEDSWTSKLAQLTGKNHYMGGYYSQKSINIAARQGGAPSLVTVAGNVTAASGATEITEAVNPVTAFSRAYDITGTLAGVRGRIRPLADEKQSFTPTVPGVYNIPPRSVFTPDAASMRDRHMTIWMGRNDRWDDGAPQQVTRSARHMVDYLSPRVKRVLVLQLVPGTDGLDHPLIKPINDMLKAEFPSAFVPIAEWMMTDRAADLAGITYTEQDLTDIAAGRIPTSFRSDNAHFNSAGCTAIAHFLHEEILKRGWL